MPFQGGRGGGKFSRDEWDEYRRRQARQHELDPAYALGWHRPTAQTASAVWELLASGFGVDIKTLLTNLRLAALEVVLRRQGWRAAAGAGVNAATAHYDASGVAAVDVSDSLGAGGAGRY
jgi:hypothetical protein